MQSSSISRITSTTSTIGLALVATLWIGTAHAQVAELEAGARSLELPALRAADLDSWADLVGLSESEADFEGIPWIDTFAGGVRAASEQRMPLLFWAMNGHPLGCT